MDKLLEKALKCAGEDVEYRKAIIKCSQNELEYHYVVNRTVEWYPLEQDIINLLDKISEVFEEIKKSALVPYKDILKISFDNLDQCGAHFITLQMFVIHSKCKVLHFVKNHESQLEQKALNAEMAEYEQYLQLKNKWEGAVLSAKGEGLYNKIQKCIEKK